MIPPSPPTEAYASLWAEECQRHAEARIRMIAAHQQIAALTARAEAAEAELATLKAVPEPSAP